MILCTLLTQCSLICCAVFIILVIVRYRCQYLKPTTEEEKETEEIGEDQQQQEDQHEEHDKALVVVESGPKLN